MAEFFSQEGIRSRAFSSDSNVKTDFSTDNLFTGVWNLNRDNLDRFDPFIQGWAAIVWTKLPAFFEKSSKSAVTTQFKHLTEKNFKSFSGISDITLEADQMSAGFTGNELPVATTIKKENTSFTLKHYELSGSPVREMYQYWITGIRDPETGVATYHGAIANGNLVYSMKNHTGELLYVVTDPSFAIGGAMGIEFAAYYTNVFPTKIPQDHLNYSSGDHGLTEIDIEFRGNYHVGTQVNNLAKNAMKSYKITKSYGDTEINTSGNLAFTGYEK
jgi:hypothetical protein